MLVCELNVVPCVIASARNRDYVIDGRVVATHVKMVTLVVPSICQIDGLTAYLAYAVITFDEF